MEVATEATVPVVYIDMAANWAVDDVQTIDDCDDALAFLTALIASIEGRITRLKAASPYDPGEYARASASLRWKSEAARLVRAKRGELIEARRNRIKADQAEANANRQARQQAAAEARRDAKARRYAANLEAQRAAIIERDRIAKAVANFVRLNHPEIYQQALQFAGGNQTTEKAA